MCRHGGIYGSGIAFGSKCWVLLLLLALSPSLAWTQTTERDSIAYDALSGLYLRYVSGGAGAPMRLRQAFTPQEYVAWRSTHLQSSYPLPVRSDTLRLPSFLTAVPAKKGKTPFRFDITGDVMLTVGGKSVQDDNPAIAEPLRRRTFFNFNQSANIRAVATYGDHLRMDVGYNTESSLLGTRRSLNLSYRGDEHDAIRSIEVGDISFVSANPLIQSGTPLFGIKGDVHVGALSLRAFASKREGASRRMTIRGGRSVRPFDLKASQYDGGRHFFLSEFFASKYDEALAHLPLVQSELHIDRVEVWVTTRTQNRTDIVIEQVGALASLSISSDTPPDNSTDSDFASMAHKPLSVWRSDAPSPMIELMEGARRLPEEAYRLHRTLGYLSLKVPLADDEALAVSYEYTYRGQRYRVGNFSEKDGETDIIVAALIASRAKEPSSPVWHLMMRNAYALPGGISDLRQEDLKVSVLYRDLSANIERRMLTSGAYAGASWTTVLGWDKSDSKGEEKPDGAFDFLSDITIDSEMGVLFVPHRRPFETVIRTVNGETSYYPVFSQLYDTTLVVAERLSDLNLFRIRGEYSTGRQTTVHLGASDLIPGSVSLVAGGRKLQEGSDFSVNYASGELTLLSSASASSDESIEILIEERDRSSHKDKLFSGIEMDYYLLPNLKIGATALDYREQGYRSRVRWGEEAIHNRMYGVHLDYSISSQRWTEWLNLLPGLDLTSPSSLMVKAAYARLDEVGGRNEEVVIEDFEQSTTTYDLLDPNAWRHASPPSAFARELGVGNRALLSWYSIDPRLVRDNMGSVMPDYLRHNRMERNGVFVREVPYTELFPSADRSALSGSFVPVVNLSYYPDERGPYNLSTDGMDARGRFAQPDRMWGGLMRSLPVRDFEAAGIAYLEGWFMDPFVENPSARGGELFIDLGRISEDILPDGTNVFENGLPSASHPERTTYETSFGIAPEEVPQTYAFDRSSDSGVGRQDVGYNGLSSAQEREHPLYRDFLERVKSITGMHPWQGDALHAPDNPYNDPAGDNYTYYLDEYWDTIEAGILTRYKYYNGVEGNSVDRLIRGQQSARTWRPDVEDINEDMQMERKEAYFRYGIEISPGGFVVGRNHIVSQRDAEVEMPEGGTKKVTWYKVRIPLGQFQERVGDAPSFRDVRVMRMFLTGFDTPVHIRWAAFRLVRSDWMMYDAPINVDDRRMADTSLGVMSIEEDGERHPVPYVMPPGIQRNSDLQGLGGVLEDERSLSLKIEKLDPGQGVAVYKSMKHDLRHYETARMFVHVESPADDPALLTDGGLTLFVRLGRDYTENYYEYTLPLAVTPLTGSAVDALGVRDIWRPENDVEIPLAALADLKGRRDRMPGYDTAQPFSESLHGRSGQRISIKGYPSLGDVTAILIGVRSSSTQVVRGEVWFNELRVSGRRHRGGDAYMLQADLRLADLSRVELTRTHLSAGFGQIDSSVRDMSSDDRRLFDLRGELNADKFFPPSWKAHIPLRYSLTRRHASPRFDPYSDDILFADKLNSLEVGQRREYERRVATSEHLTHFAIEDLHFDVKDSVSRPWDPAHFRLSYRQSRSEGYSPDLYDSYRRDANTLFLYHYKPAVSGVSLGKSITLYPYPQEYSFTSRWRRVYDHKQYRSSDDSLSHHLYHRFDWDRTLRLGWSPLDMLRFTWESTTEAIIDEPYEQELRRTGRVAFRALSDTILHSLLRLGTTVHYSGRVGATLRLPAFKQEFLRGLSGSYTWRSHYRWERGAGHPGTMGHNARQTGSRDLTLSYHLPKLLKHLALHYRETWGSHIPGLLSEAGVLFGLSSAHRPFSPGLGYMLGVGDTETHLRRVLGSDGVVTDIRYQRPLTWYDHSDIDVEVGVEPLPGLRIDFAVAHSHHRRSELTPSRPDEAPRRMGSFSTSTIGLRNIFTRPMRQLGYSSPLFDSYKANIRSRGEELRHAYATVGETYADALSSLVTHTHTDVLALAFEDTYTTALSGRKLSVRPSLLSVMPNWSIRYDLTAIHPEVRRHFVRLALAHRYRGRVEVNNYRIEPLWLSLGAGEIGYRVGASGAVLPGSEREVQSMTQRDELSPLIGIEATLQRGLGVDLRFNKVRELSLLTQSARLLEQYRDEIVSTVRYKATLPSLLALLKHKRKETSTLSAQYSLIFGRNYIISRDLRTYLSQATQGIETLTTRLSIDYTLTSNITLRGYYDYDRRTPIVSNRTYPYVSKSYGLMLRLHLTP